MFPVHYSCWFYRTRPTCSFKLSSPLPAFALQPPATLNYYANRVFCEMPLLQYWMLSKIGEIRRDESCLDYAGLDVILYPCHGSKGNQYWSYNPHVSIKKIQWFYFDDLMYFYFLYLCTHNTMFLQVCYL